MVESGAAPLGGTDIETMERWMERAIGQAHGATGKPCQSCLDALDAMDRIERVVEAAKALQYASQGVRFAALQEALGALDG